MKRILFLLLSLVLLPLQAQVIITRSDLAYQEGDRHSFNNTDPLDLVTGISPETAGPNVSWDFSTVNVSILVGKTSVYVDPASTPFAAQVEGANLAIKNEDEINGPYQFVNLTDEGLEHYYTGWYEDGISAFYTFTPSLKALEFPMSYGQTFEQDYVAELYKEGSLFMIDSSSASVEVDAWGTVTTPVGTFTDVLRMKRTTIASGYMYYDGNWVHTADLSTIVYSWFKAGIHTALINVSGFLDEEGYTLIWLTNPGSTGMEEPKTVPELRIWPNPATEFLNIESEAIEELTLYDIAGKLTLEANANGASSLRLTTSGLSRGSYLLEVRSGGATIRQIVVLY